MITDHTYDMIFSGKPGDDPKRRPGKSMDSGIGDFVRDYGTLDVFLAEMFASAKTLHADPTDAKETWTWVRPDRVKDHKTKIKQLLREQRHNLTVSKTERANIRGTISTGTIISDRYEVKSFIGSGGYGSVYKGFDTKLRRSVAIKLLKRRPIDPNGNNQRFLQEGQILAKLNHPNIVQIYDVGEVDRYYYIVMEYIEGEDLGSFIKTSKKDYEPSRLFPLMKKISDALAAIHKEGILHRDIKPSNIMVDIAGNPKLMDFGISKRIAMELNKQPALTGEGTFLGTAEFMAPEQFSKPDQVTCSSDVYSLGCTFYKLLTGTNPIPGKTFLDFHRNHLEFEPTPIREIAPSLPLSWCNIIHKMMEKKPEKRYQDGAAVKEALLSVNKKRSVPRLVMLIGSILIVLFGMAIFANLYTPRPEWFPKPRTIAVIPFADEANQYSFVSTEFTKLLKTHYNFYNTVERGDIFKALEELELNKSNFISKEDSIRIGKLVGAHIFVMFEVRNLKGNDVIYPKVFDVETLLLLGLAKIPSETLESYDGDNTTLKSSLDVIMNGVADELVYRSYVGSVHDGTVDLDHGRLYGASAGMKLKALDKRGRVAGIVEITMADKNTARGKIMSGVNSITEGLRVEEIK